MHTHPQALPADSGFRETARWNSWGDSPAAHFGASIHASADSGRLWVSDSTGTGPGTHLRHGLFSPGLLLSLHFICAFINLLRQLYQQRSSLWHLSWHF